MLNRPGKTAIKKPEGRSTLGGRPLILEVDLLLLLAVVGLLVCSLITIGFATKDDVAGNPYYYVERQALYAAVGLILMSLMVGFNYSRLREFKVQIYGVLIASILLVLALGTAARGSRRWIELPFFRYQPSELGKLLLIVAISAFILDRSRKTTNITITARTVFLTGIPALLVIVQPDLGTGLVYAAIMFTLLFIAGQPWQHFLALGAAVAVLITLVFSVGPAMGITLLKPYQMDRLTAFLHPTEDPSKEGYQQAQSRIAIGSGERFGRGVDHATQTRLNFLPEHHTDFIFAVVGETYGFVGGGLVLALFSLLIWRGLRAITVAKDMFGSLIAAGIVAMILFQVVVNVGMTVGIMPITGIPLPLVSYGGSSLMVTLLAVGLLQAIYAQGKAAARTKGQVIA